MQDEEQLLKKRFTELARRADTQQRYAYTEFLTLAEQDTLRYTSSDMGSAPYILDGGYEGAERCLAQFGSQALCGYSETPPITCMRLQPISQKFADALSHRDFLGALMALGVRRSVLGDILLVDNCGYLFCLDSIADFVIAEFSQVKHTSIKCERIDALPEMVFKKPDITSVNVASERLDAVIAAVYKMSRSDSQSLFAQGKVSVNSRLTENTSLQINPGAVISVRGYGRFIYEGIAKETKKGRLFISVRVY